MHRPIAVHAIYASRTETGSFQLMHMDATHCRSILMRLGFAGLVLKLSTVACENRHATPARAVRKPLVCGGFPVRASDPPQLQLDDELIFHQVAHCGPDNLPHRAVSDIAVGPPAHDDSAAAKASGQGIASHSSTLVQRDLSTRSQDRHRMSWHDHSLDWPTRCMTATAYNPVV